jgi:hypothetical protein
MNRRNFLRSALGLGAVAIAAPLLPSEVWPFRKIFLPAQSRVDFLDLRYWGTAQLPPIEWWNPIIPFPEPGTWLGLSRTTYPGRLLTPLQNRTTLIEVPKELVQREMRKFMADIDRVIAEG